MQQRSLMLCALPVIAMLIWNLPAPAEAQFSQQGPKLVGTDAVGEAVQGYSVSISADGNTALVGGDGDNGGNGAAWVYTRSGGVWSQQGSKLVGTGAQGPRALQGYSVSLSGDGNIGLVGGYADNNDAGAAWVFTRSGGVWSQQGPKLVGTGAIGNAWQGASISLSNDGGTAIVGGLADNDYVGAAWVYTQPVFAGMPGKPNCHGKSVSALAQQYGGLYAAAAALGYSSVQVLQNDIAAYCLGCGLLRRIGSTACCDLAKRPSPQSTQRCKFSSHPMREGWPSRALGVFEQGNHR